MSLIRILLRSNNSSWFVYTTCKLVLAIFSTYPPFKLNAFDTTGPSTVYLYKTRLTFLNTSLIVTLVYLTVICQKNYYP